MAIATVTPPVAAPAAAAPAPAATPSSTPAAAPPPSSTPAVTPAEPISTPAAAATTPAGIQPPAEPDYSGMESDEWLRSSTAHNAAMEEFKKANPDYQPAKTEETQPVAEVTDPNAEVPAAEPFSLEDEPAITPQSLNDILQGDQAIKSAIDANPKVRNALHKLARENAELQPYRGMFPNVDAAKFAKTTADRTVGLRRSIMTAETPEQMSGAYDSFAQEFAVVGADGKQVVVDGVPQFADDFYAFNEHVVGRYADNTLAMVEARLNADKYPNEAAKVRDQDLKVMVELLREDLSGQVPEDRPSTEGMSPEAAAALESRWSDLKTREDALAGKATEAQKTERKAKVAQANTEYMEHISQRTFDSIQGILREFRTAGALIPEWMLTATAPGSNVPIFYQNIANDIEAALKADPYTYQSMVELEMKPPTPENAKARKEFFDRFLKDNARAIVKKQVREFGKQQIAEAAKKADPPNTASVEPRSQSAPRPQVMTKEDAYKAATEQLKKSIPGWDNLSPSEQLGHQMTLAPTLMGKR